MSELGSNLIQDDEEVVAAPKATAPAVVKTNDKADYIRILIEENDDIPPNGLMVGLNGRHYLIRPGEIVKVPPGVVGILNDAVTSRPTMDPTTRRVIGYRPAKRFPFRLVSDAEAEAANTA